MSFRRRGTPWREGSLFFPLGVGSFGVLLVLVLL